MMINAPKLTSKQTLFVQEYLIDLNATQAAIRAGYSKKTAYSIGNENLSKPDIAQAIQAAKEKRSERTGITADTVMANIEELRIKAEESKQLSVAAKCLELQGKHLSMFKDNTGDTLVNIVINR